MQSKFNRISKVTNAAFFLFFTITSLICLAPLVFVASISLSSERSIQDLGYSMIPRVFSVEAYVFLSQQSAIILRALMVSAGVTVFGTLLGAILTTSIGYAISRPGYKLRGFLTWVVFIPMVFNGGLVSTYYINSNLLGLRDSFLALVLPLAVSSFNVVVAKTFFKSTIPESLIESAKLDGAGQIAIYARIALPLSLPVIAAISLFLSFSYWNDWFQSMLYIDDAKKLSLQALLTQIMANVDYLAKNAATMGISSSQLARSMPKEGARMAIAALIVIPIACAYPFFQKYFISGLTVGAVKG
ncbi:MAG: carbohydrate ABC transporter permease [Clostridiales bacterium]|jgi:putative aldouronate transport system permease protein|nr:carbohydrate ABC transporter permease [Clostridiales bacterium]MDR2749172.1 carbohydrate ABC transporter permease [Clostridiales bacterium]